HDLGFDRDISDVGRGGTRLRLMKDGRHRKLELPPRANGQIDGQKRARLVTASTAFLMDLELGGVLDHRPPEDYGVKEIEGGLRRDRRRTCEGKQRKERDPRRMATQSEQQHPTVSPS